MITYHREALSLRPSGHPDRSPSLGNLADALFARYMQLGNMENLEEGITYYREALSLRPPGHLDRSTSLNSLATAVLTRYEQCGRMEDLEEVIAISHEALSLCPPGHQDHPESLNNLANAIFTRFEQSGSMEDLDEVIKYSCEVLTFCPPGHPLRPSALSIVANGSISRYWKSGRMEDLEEGITCHREILSLYPPGHPSHSVPLINLAAAVNARYEQYGRLEDCEEAITHYREALSLCPPGHPDRSIVLCNLATSILSRYEQLGNMVNIEEGITYHREALSLRPPGHPDRSLSLISLADALRTRYQQSAKDSNVQDLEESFTLCQQAANDSTSSFRHRLTASLHWAHAARRHRHSSLIDAYSTSLHLLDRCLISYPDVTSQQKFLATRTPRSLASAAFPEFDYYPDIPISLASDAASAAIDANELQVAVELLEQGRAILWSRMKGYRYPLDNLRHVNRQLADEFERLCTGLEHLALSSQSNSRPMDDDERLETLAYLDVQIQKNRILSEEWDKVIGQIRKIEGYSNFLQAVPFSTLRMAAVEGPVILINISNYRSDAIIIHIDKPPTLVRLPKATPKQLTDLGEQLATALTVRQSSKLIYPILRHLWNDIVSPVCDSLTQLAIPRKSRIWWCPTSELCALPIHAAGLYQPNQPNFNLHNIYVSSYIPTLSALISARSSPIASGGSVVPNLLVIGQPGEDLPMVQDEIDNIKQFGDFVNVIVGADASRDAVLHGLQQHSWAHFACHGHMGDNSQPFHASFELYGGTHLNLLDLIQARLPNSEFAFLAACHSAAGDPSSPDEVIHLAAALQFCGFRSVVGTLWAVADKAGPIISKEFYKHMFNNPAGNKADFRDSAKALNLAVRALWKERAPLEDWISFVHIGA